MCRYLALVIAALVTGKAAQPRVVWQQVLGGTGSNEALHGMDLQYPSVLYVVGEDSVEDLAVLKLDLDGNLALAYTYDDGEEEIGKDISIGEAGNVYVIGHRADSTLLYLKFDSEGNKVWDHRRFDHLGGHVLYSEDGVYFAGWYYLTSDPDLRITKYDKDGGTLWSDWWQPARDQTPTGLALDFEESIIFIACRYPYMWGSWQSDGTPRVGIIPRYETDLAHGEGIALNSADHVFLCGDIGSGARTFMLIKNDISGNFLWPDSAKRYDLGADEHCRDIKLDSISDCYLAGWQARGAEEDIALVKTDSAGNMLWVWVDTVEGKQEIEGIEVDEEGYIYLAGSHHNGTDWDMLVMKVTQPLTITGRVTDSLGKPMGDFPVLLSGDTTVEVLTDTGGYYCIEVYNGGEYTVSPNLPGWSFTPSSHTYTPLAHREFDQDFADGRWTGIAEPPIRESPSWELVVSVGSRIVLRYSNFPDGLHGCIFNAAGRKVDKLVSASLSGTITWPVTPVTHRGFTRGVYFIRISSGARSAMRKVVLLR